MAKPKSDDTDIPETKPEDWTGAAIRQGGERGPLRAKPGGRVFHVFRASTDPSLFGVTNEGNAGALPACPEGGGGACSKQFQELVHARMGFSGKDARAEIDKQGYHLNRITIEAGEATVSSVAS